MSLHPSQSSSEEKLSQKNQTKFEKYQQKKGNYCAFQNFSRGFWGLQSLEFRTSQRFFPKVAASKQKFSSLNK